MYLESNQLTIINASNFFVDLIFSESETPEPYAVSEEREISAELTAGSDDEQAVEEKKKKKTKKTKKVVKKKAEKKEKEDTLPSLKLDVDTKPKVNKSKMFEQKKPVEEAKPPPKARVTGKLTGALAAMKAEEVKMKEAEEQKKQIEEKMKRMKEEQEAKKTAAAEGEHSENEEGEHSGDENASEKGVCICLHFFSVQ